MKIIHEGGAAGGYAIAVANGGWYFTSGNSLREISKAKLTGRSSPILDSDFNQGREDWVLVRQQWIKQTTHLSDRARASPPRTNRACSNDEIWADSDRQLAAYHEALHLPSTLFLV